MLSVVGTPRFQLSSAFTGLLILPWLPQNHENLASEAWSPDEPRVALTIA